MTSRTAICGPCLWEASRRNGRLCHLGGTAQGGRGQRNVAGVRTGRGNPPGLAKLNLRVDSRTSRAFPPSGCGVAVSWCCPAGTVLGLLGGDQEWQAGEPNFAVRVAVGMDDEVVPFLGSYAARSFVIGMLRDLLAGPADDGRDVHVPDEEQQRRLGVAPCEIAEKLSERVGDNASSSSIRSS